jgi:methyltransferase family protein
MAKLFKNLKRALFPGSDVRGNLLRNMPKDGICAEVGTWKADFSERILKITQPKKLYLIDPYKFFGEYKKAKFGGKAEGQEKMDDIFQSVSNKFSEQIVSGQVEIFRENSINGIEKIENNTLDWIYIDGNHTYDFVKGDLNAAWDKVKINGFITGDDYGLEGWWENGVTKAVDEFTEDRKNQLKIISIEKTQFILQKIKD